MARSRKPRPIEERFPIEPSELVDRAPLGNEGVEWLIAEIKEKVCQKDAIFSLPMMANLAAMQPDGRYHTARFMTGDEFAFTGLRLGKRDQLIFEFKPIDPGHKQVEANEDKVSDTSLALRSKSSRRSATNASHSMILMTKAVF